MLEVAENTASAPATAPRKPARRFELDWLRALVVLGLVPYHAAIIFIVGQSEYIKSPQTSQVMRVIVTFLILWGMPLLFLISGAGSWFALESRTGWLYLRERFSRLLVPFIFGVLVVVPPMVYYGYISNPHYHKNYFQFYLDYLGMNADLIHGDSSNNFIYLWGHLWFIPLLLFFSVIALPVFLLLKRSAWRKRLSRLGKILHKIPGSLLMLGVPIVLVELVVHVLLPSLISSDYLDYTNWDGFGLFLLSFVLGYLLYANHWLEQSILRDGPLAIGLGLAVFIGEEWLIFSHTLPAAGTLANLLLLIAHGFNYWFWIVALLFIGKRFFAFSNALLLYLRDAAYPWYVLHLPILTIIAYYVVRGKTPLIFEFGVICLSTYALMALIYEFGIRRWNLMRLLFGLQRLPAPKK
jgi:glucan biosynthesis protein C